LAAGPGPRPLRALDGPAPERAVAGSVVPYHADAGRSSVGRGLFDRRSGGAVSGQSRGTSGSARGASSGVERGELEGKPTLEFLSPIHGNCADVCCALCFLAIVTGLKQH